MRRRPSESTDEDDTVLAPSVVTAAASAAPALSQPLKDELSKHSLDHHVQGTRAEEANRDLTRMSETKDRGSSQQAQGIAVKADDAWEDSESSRPELDSNMELRDWRRTRNTRSLWRASWLTILTTAISVLLVMAILHSFNTRQLDPKGCQMSMMIPAYVRLSDFDTEHTRFATKYSLYLYREQGIDEDPMVRHSSSTSGLL